MKVSAEFLTPFLASLLILLASALALLHAQSPPSISNRVVAGQIGAAEHGNYCTITLSNLAVNNYTAVVFRADLTGYRNAERNYDGDDIGKDIEIAVADSQETFTVRVFDRTPGMTKYLPCCPARESGIRSRRVSVPSSATPATQS